jgi:hypothetical protein
MTGRSLAPVGPISISHHAAVRYIERVDPCLTPVEAVSAIRQHDRAIDVAALFGCPLVKLGSGARLVLIGWDVVTVLARDQRPPSWGIAR